jgi:hypothetical protein
MIGDYKITDLTNLGFSSVEVEGSSFHMQDLHEMIGRTGYMTSFQFRSASGTSLIYGQVITGTLFNSFNTLNFLEGAEPSTSLPDLSILRIDSPDRFLSIEQKKSLKYQGVSINDLEKISYFSYSRAIERHASGEKKIPNVVEIEADFSDIDESNLLINYLVAKNNSGCELVHFEKEELIGTLLGKHGCIDRRLLEHLRLTLEDVKININIGLARLKAKSKHHHLTEDDEKEKVDLLFIKRAETIMAVAAEMEKAKLSKTMLPTVEEALRAIVKSANEFRPGILLHGKKQIFWDLRSYLHIAMRHLSDFQLGKFEEKTVLPYRPKDLSALIEKVLSRIADEIELHFKTEKSPFRRRGGMAVFFNGDYFSLIIDSDGRIEQFHSLGKQHRKAS